MPREPGRVLPPALERSPTKVRNALEINNFVMAGARLGVVGHFDWIKPLWSWQHVDDDAFKLTVGVERDGDGGGGRYVVGGTGWNRHKALYWRDNWPNGELAGPEAVRDPLFELEYHTTLNNPIIHMMLERWMKLASDKQKLVERF